MVLPVADHSVLVKSKRTPTDAFSPISLRVSGEQAAIFWLAIFWLRGNRSISTPAPASNRHHIRPAIRAGQAGRRSSTILCPAFAERMKAWRWPERWGSTRNVLRDVPIDSSARNWAMEVRYKSGAALCRKADNIVPGRRYGAGSPAAAVSINNGQQHQIIRHLAEYRRKLTFRALSTMVTRSYQNMVRLELPAKSIPTGANAFGKAFPKQNCPSIYSPVTDHDSSDNCGVEILGMEGNDFWKDHKGAQMNAIRTRTLIEKSDVVVVRFGENTGSGTRRLDAGFAAALGKPVITLHDEGHTHALAEVDAAALAVAQTPEQVVRILDYVIEVGDYRKWASEGRHRPRRKRQSHCHRGRGKPQHPTARTTVRVRKPTTGTRRSAVQAAGPEESVDRQIGLLPPKNGSVFRVIKFPPEKDWIDNVDPDAAKASFASIGAGRRVRPRRPAAPADA